MRFTDTPLQNLDQAKKEREKAALKFKNVQHKRPSSANAKSTVRMGFILIIFLPILFFISIFSKNNLLLIIYSIITLLVLLPTWIYQLITVNARTTLTAIHITMVLMAMFMVVLNPTPRPPQNKARPENSINSGFNSVNEVTKSSSLDTASKKIEEQNSSVPVSEVTVSPIEERINEFMKAWEDANYKKMGELSDTDKLDPSRSIETSMFHIRANRTPRAWYIIDTSGNDADYTRTVNMEVHIDKNNGTPIQVHRMQILLVKKNSTWFVDPKSLNSLGVLKTLEDEVSDPIATIPPQPEPPMDTMLYFNPDGGSLYHADQNCKLLKPEYLPMRGSFLYMQINDPEYKKLEPCTGCKAPRRPR